MKILWIWEIVVDKTYIIDWFLKEDQKKQSVDSFYSVWWPVPSALAILSNLWCDTNFIWVVWKDEFSYFIQKELELYDIKTNLIFDKKTKVNTVIVNEIKSTRTIIRDTDENKNIEEIKVSLIKEADIIIFDRHEFEAFKFVMKHKRKETEIILDLSAEYSQKVIDMMESITYPIFSIEAVQKASNSSYFEKPFEEVYKTIKKSFIATAWKEWVYLYDWKNLILKKWLKVNAIDNNWAWDVFRWAFAYGLLQKWDLEKIVDFSIIVSALQCEKVWNLSAIPTKKEIEKYFKF